MKRFLSFLLLFVCMFFSSSFAEEEKAEILFRDNPWCSSFDMVKKSFPSKVSWLSLYDKKAYQVESRLFRSEDAKQYDAYVACTVSPASYKLEAIGFTVAGYPVSDVDLLFAYVPGDNGLIDHKNPATALYFAEYTFHPKDMRIVFDDLKNKLSALYGEFVEIYSVNAGVENELTYLSWFGSNDAAVTLVYYGKQKEIYIRYGYLKGNELLDKAYDALLLEEKMTDSSNTDGL